MIGIKTIVKSLGLFTILLFVLVILVSIDQGPLISVQSMILGILGSIIIIMFASGIARKINLVDIPDNQRRDHIGSIPLVGGFGVFFSLAYGAIVFGVDLFHVYILIALIPIIIVGTIDGLQGINISAVYRVIAQIIACWIVILASDIYIKDLGDLFGFGNFQLGKLGIPFTIFAIVGICNAFNMLDGKDGLLGTVSIVIIMSLILFLFLSKALYIWPIALMQSILIFLCFNLSLFGKSRKIFLGDHGSTGIGFILAWELIFLSQELSLISPISAVWLVLLPLTDAILTFFRRIRSENSIFEADRLHLHHILSDSGFKNNSILAISALITAFGSITALFANLYQLEEYNLFYAYMTLLVIGILLSNEKKKEA